MQTIIGLAAAGLILVFAGLSRLLLFHRRKCATAFPGNLHDFGLVIRRGWRLALQNWLVALSLLGLGLFTVFQRAFFQWIHLRDDYFTPFWPRLQVPPGFSRELLVESLFSALSALPARFRGLLHSSFLPPGNILSVALVVFAALMARRLWKFLPRDHPPSGRSGLDFTRRGLILLVVLLPLAAVYEIFALAHGAQLPVIAYFLVLPRFYVLVSLIALTRGFVLLCFRDSFSGSRPDWKTVLCSSRRFFKPLLQFSVLLALLTLPFNLVFSVRPALIPADVRLYLFHTSNLLSLIFTFTPFFIVLNNRCLKEALGDNFRFWRRAFPQALTLVFLSLLFFWLIDVIILALRPFSAPLSILSMHSLASVAITGPARFLVMAVTAALLLSRSARGTDTGIPGEEYNQRVSSE